MRYAHRCQDEADRRHVVVGPSDGAMAAVNVAFGPLRVALADLLDEYSVTELAVVQGFIQTTRVIVQRIVELRARPGGEALPQAGHFKSG